MAITFPLHCYSTRKTTFAFVSLEFTVHVSKFGRCGRTRTYIFCAPKAVDYPFSKHTVIQVSVSNEYYDHYPSKPLMILLFSLNLYNIPDINQQTTTNKAHG
ncbi:hypothetical protein BRC2024_KCUCJSVR_CDS_0169 [Acinetobacter phage vB_AbaM_KissB]